MEYKIEYLIGCSMSGELFFMNYGYAKDHPPAIPYDSLLEAMRLHLVAQAEVKNRGERTVFAHRTVIDCFGTHGITYKIAFEDARELCRIKYNTVMLDDGKLVHEPTRYGIGASCGINF